MRVALIHDSLTQYGGAERVVEVISEIWPEAPIFTLFYDETKTKGRFSHKPIIESFWVRAPLLGKIVRRLHNRLFFWLMPIAVERFNLSDFDIVISSSATYAKGVLRRRGALHLNYCHTPTRYLWEDVRNYASGFYESSLVRFVGEFFFRAVRRWDRAAAWRPDLMVANSTYTANRIRQIYGREVDAVIFPPVEPKFFNVIKNSKLNDCDYYLMVGRLLKYKRFDLGIEASRNLGFKLKIAGDGPEKKALLRNAPREVEFLGWVDDEKLIELYLGAKALIFPQVEDFGLVAAEAIATGTPVIAYRAGGALDIIKEGENGIFFDHQTPKALAEAIKRFENIEFDTAKIRASATRFSKEKFQQEIINLIKSNLKNKSNL
jgi:glycosyltransferase involved in cell wall biosynthesis